jgi:hypothetical protein
VLLSSKVTLMNTEPEIAADRELLMDSASLDSMCAECPHHVAIEGIAQAAVKQHVLFLEGECQPRNDLLRRLDAWSSLHALIRSRICVASRVATISPDELERTLDALSRDLPELRGDAGPLDYRQLRDALAGCAQAVTCPLGALSRDRTVKWQTAPSDPISRTALH